MNGESSELVGKRVKKAVIVHEFQNKFPVLLNQLMIGLERGGKDNLKSCLKTGIHPLYRNVVLQQLPTAVVYSDSSSISDIVGKSFINHFQKKWKDDTQFVNKKHTNVNILAGRIITSADYSGSGTFSYMHDNDLLLDLISSSDEIYFDVPAFTTSTPVPPTQSNSINLGSCKVQHNAFNPGDYILISFKKLLYPGK